VSRTLTQRFANSVEYSLQDTRVDLVMDCLLNSEHFLVYTRSYEEDGKYIIASGSLFEHPDLVARLLSEAFHVEELTPEDAFHMVDHNEDVEGTEYEEEPHYLIVLSPVSQFTWRGRVMMLNIPKTDLGLEDNRARIIADGAGQRLQMAKDTFAASLVLEEDDLLLNDNDSQTETEEMLVMQCISEQQAHLPAVNRELRKIVKTTIKLAESIVDSVHHVRRSMNMADGCQELMENWYSFASEHGQHALKYMDRSSLPRFNQQLTKLAISWVTFICDDCDPNDRRTFKWAVIALEYTFQRISRNILNLPDDQFIQLRHKVGICISLLMGHFDILGARTSLEAQKEKERQEEELRRQGTDASMNDEDLLSYADMCAGPTARKFWEKVSRAIQEVEEVRNQVGVDYRMLGRVLDNEKLEDRSLVFLASASSNNFSIRWQQGKFIGAGAFGSVYTAVNLDSGALMAVKEIKFTELAGSPTVIKQITDELRVMEMLHHPNIVEYYGIEVHRDKVYIFEEYCEGGSLAAFLEHGTVEDEGLIQVYTLQMLEGLDYLHSQGVVHRDVKPDSKPFRFSGDLNIEHAPDILLHHTGILKFVDFGAAKILARNQRSTRFTFSRRAGPDLSASNNGSAGPAVMPMGNSLTGTPMYMSPEVIKNDKRGQFGAMDIWSMGCVVLELATGKKPWRNLDNEWYVLGLWRRIVLHFFSVGLSCSILELQHNTHHCQNRDS
jgi:mitogen-activated protein kinase kinase kinase